MISRFFTTTFTVYRLTYTGNKGSYGSSGTFMGHLQQASQEDIINGRQQESITHTIWCAPSTNVKVSDRLAADGRSYTVRAIQENDSVGANQHLEVLVERDDFISA